MRPLRHKKNQQNEDKKNEDKTALFKSLEANLKEIKEATGNSEDIVFREIRFGEDQHLRAAFICTEGLTDTNAFHQFVLEPLMVELKRKDWGNLDSTSVPWMKLIEESILPISGVKEVHNFEDLYTYMLSGEVIFLLQGVKQGYTISLKKWKDRGVTEAQGVIRGPRESFSETLRTNTALIRRKINDPSLRLESKTIGRVTKTRVSLMYIQGIVKEHIIKEVHTRIDRIEIDGILESGYIEELIQDNRNSPFPTIYHTERPDGVAAGLLEGRVAILVDGTPVVLLVPSLFNQFFQATEDYYERSLIASLTRMLRFVCAFISLLAPAVYIAVTTFHQEMVPTTLLISLMVQREGVPFPAFVEAFLMELVLEILREAVIRLPKAVGQTVSFVGAIVIGQAAVEAGIVSASMVIVVAITGIANFVIPAYNMSIALRILRFILMMLAASFGFFGLMLGLIAILLHLCSIRSFGMPYMSPFGPYNPIDIKDSIFRLPLWKLSFRPTSIEPKDLIRADNQPPTKPNE